MFWEEDDDKTLPFVAPDNVFDVLFSIECKRLPLDHAWALSQQLLQHLPWLSSEPCAGIQPIHVAESNNGWMRPEAKDALLFPSKRSKLSLRIPATKFAEVQNLHGKTLDIDGHPLTLGRAKKKALVNAGVIFARHVLTQKGMSEPDFLSQIATEIEQKTGTKVKKMLCGKNHTIYTPKALLHTKHLMIADLDDETSITLQQLGIGERRELGCGLFLPHKSIKTLKPTE